MVINSIKTIKSIHKKIIKNSSHFIFFIPKSIATLQPQKRCKIRY